MIQQIHVKRNLQRETWRRICGAYHAPQRSDVISRPAPRFEPQLRLRLQAIPEGPIVRRHVAIASGPTPFSVYDWGQRAAFLMDEALAFAIPFAAFGFAECCLVPEHLNPGVLRVHAFPASQSAPAPISEMFERNHIQLGCTHQRGARRARVQLGVLRRAATIAALLAYQCAPFSMVVLARVAAKFTRSVPCLARSTLQ